MSVFKRLWRRFARLLIWADAEAFGPSAWRVKQRLRRLGLIVERSSPEWTIDPREIEFCKRTGRYLELGQGDA